MTAFWILLLLMGQHYTSAHHDALSRWSIDTPVSDDMLKVDVSTSTDDDDFVPSANNELYESDDERLTTGASRLKNMAQGKASFHLAGDHERAGDSGFIRFGRNGGGLARTGFIRFGRSEQPGFVRHVKDDPEAIRFGRRGDQFIRLGRGGAPKERLENLSNDELRGNIYNRFGRRDDGFIRLGKKSIQE